MSDWRAAKRRHVGLAPVEHWVVLDRGPPPRRPDLRHRYCVMPVAASETAARVAAEQGASLVDAPPGMTMDEACELQQRMQAVAEAHED